MIEPKFELRRRLSKVTGRPLGDTGLQHTAELTPGTGAEKRHPLSPIGSPIEIVLIQFFNRPIQRFQGRLPGHRSPVQHLRMKTASAQNIGRRLTPVRSQQQENPLDQRVMKVPDIPRLKIRNFAFLQM
jgi:hypothetical protein